MDISVIIPAYNAAPFIERAVGSAISLDEVAEIIIIEDGSTDETLERCIALQKKYANITVLRHNRGENQGVSASRNLGVCHAKHEFIAFLDADDIFLPNRFTVEIETFDRKPDIDGIYGALEAMFITKAGEQKFKDLKMKRLTTITHPVAPEELVWVLFGKSKEARGHFSLDTLTVRRRLLDTTGGFDSNLAYGEDTDLIMRMAVKGKLMSGSIDNPIALRGIHDENHVTDSKAINRHKEAMWKKIYEWGANNEMPKELVTVARDRMLSWRTHNLGFLRSLAFLLAVPLKYPQIWASPILLRRTVFGVFGENLLSKAVLRFRGFLGWRQQASAMNGQKRI